MREERPPEDLWNAAHPLSKFQNATSLGGRRYQMGVVKEKLSLVLAFGKEPSVFLVIQ